MTRYARRNGLLFFETSARTGLNVNAAFEQTAETVLLKVERGEVDSQDPKSGVRRARVRAASARGKVALGEVRRHQDWRCELGSQAGIPIRI